MGFEFLSRLVLQGLFDLGRITAARIRSMKSIRVLAAGAILSAAIQPTLGAAPPASTVLGFNADGTMTINPLALLQPRFQICLPTQQCFTLVRDRLDHHSMTSFAWVGHVEGEPNSRLVCGISGGVLSFSFDRSTYEEGETWMLRPSANFSYSFGRETNSFTCTATAGPTPEFAPAGPSVGASVVNAAGVASLTVPNTVDLLAVYSPASKARWGKSGLEAMIIQAVADVNTTLTGSWGQTFVKLVGMQEVAYTEQAGLDIGTVLGRMIVTTDGHLDDVPPIRDQVGADLVTLISEDTGASGVAYIPYLTGAFRPEWGYSVINSGQLSFGTLAHELGHNLGCNHDRDHLNSTGQSPTPYAFGHQSCGVNGLGFRDIMSYECTTGGVSQRLNFFSTPWLKYLGKPLGVDYAADPVNAADNARTIREVAPIVATFRTSVQSFPAVPATFGGTSTAFNRVDLTWTTTGSNHAGFEIQRSSDAGASWATVGIVSSGTTAFVDRPLDAGATYVHRVRAFNSAGSGPFSSGVTTTTSAQPAVPSAPTGLVITHVSAARIDLKWTDIANSEDGYRVKRSINGGPFDEIAELGPDTTGYNDGDQLVTGNTYEYRIIPYNAAGDGDRLSGSLNLVPAPSAPNGLYFVPLTSNSAQLFWTDTAANENGFNIERATDGVTYFLWATRTANVTTITNTSLFNGATYGYRIWSHNNSGQSALAATGSFTWGQVPAAPSVVQASGISPNLVAVTWEDNSKNESAFYIDRSLDDVNYSPLASVGPNTTTFSDATVLPGTSYYYRVRSYNLFGYSSIPASDPLKQNSITTASDGRPPAPTSLNATPDSTSQVALTWVDNSSDEFSFNIERRTGAGAFEVVGTAPADATSFVDTGLSEGTSYSYRISAGNESGTSAYSLVATVTTSVAIPAAPVGLTVTAVSASQVNVAWVDQANNETSVYLEQSFGSVSFTVIATLPANTVSYSVTGLIANTAYSYRVRVGNAGGYSTYSPVVSATTLIAAPTMPGSALATANSSSQITLTWVDASADETGFVVERSAGGGGYSVIATLGANVNSYVDSGLTPGTTYSYRICATNGGGLSAYSNTASATTLVAVPARPGSPVATAISSSQISLTWVDASTDEIGFSVERSAGGGAYAVVASLGANVSSYVDSGLTSATSYSYRVRASNASGFSPYSNLASAVTLLAVPVTPGNPLATANSTSQITLTWVDASSDETGFSVERSTAGGAYSVVATLGANVTSYVNSGLTSATPYSYRVRASNAAGFSEYSMTATATTLTSIPTAPASPVATANSSSQITLTWVDASNSETEFSVERRVGSGSYSVVATVGANVASYVNSGLTASTTYTYRIRASNSAGYSAYSSTASGTTLAAVPAVPGNPVAIANSSSQVTVAWLDASNDETGFSVERSTGGGAYSVVATLGANVGNFVNTGLSASTTYSYRIRASNAVGYSAYSATTAATTPAVQTVASPTGLTATVDSSSRITLKWSDNANNEGNYYVERSVNGGSYSVIATLGANSVTYVNSSLNSSTTYAYRVRAGGGGAYSAYSPVVTTRTSAPSAPTGLGAGTIARTSLVLNWVDNSNNETGFKIERLSGSRWSQIATTTAGVNSVSVSGLNANTSYSFRVRSYNGVGNSSYSTTLITKTLP